MTTKPSRFYGMKDELLEVLFPPAYREQSERAFAEKDIGWTSSCIRNSTQAFYGLNGLSNRSFSMTEVDSLGSSHSMRGWTVSPTRDLIFALVTGPTEDITRLDEVRELWVEGEGKVLWANVAMVSRSFVVEGGAISSVNHVRFIASNPVRGFSMFTPWATDFQERWRTDSVRSLVQCIWEHKRVDLLPILRDALLEADCDNEKIIRRVVDIPPSWWVKVTGAGRRPWLFEIIDRGIDFAENVFGRGNF